MTSGHGRIHNRLGQDAQATPTKPVLRETLKHALRATTDHQRADWSRIICRALIASDLIPAAPSPGRSSAILLYAPILTMGEVDIAPVADELARRGVPIAIPRHDWATRAMTPVRVANLSTDLIASTDLINQRLGLRAARPDASEIPLSDLHAVIVPGLAFDRRGHRLGRGGGFYDRFLARLPQTVRTIGVAFDLQLVDEVPADPHDAPVQTLITECRVERFASA